MADHPAGSGHSGTRSSVKSGLTPNRRRRTVENDEYEDFIPRIPRIPRILRAYSRRVADGDVEALSLMTGLASELDNAIAQAVKGLRSRGYSWAEIGTRLGITPAISVGLPYGRVTRPRPRRDPRSGAPTDCKKLGQTASAG